MAVTPFDRIVSQATRYLFAARQDADVGIAALHYSYAVCGLAAALELTSDPRQLAVLGAALRRARDEQHAVQRTVRELTAGAPPRF